MSTDNAKGRERQTERARELEMKENTMWLAICFSHWISFWPKICFWNSPFLVHAPKKQWRLKHIIILLRGIWQPSLNARYRINNLDLACTYTHDIFHMRQGRIFLEHRTMFIWPNAFNLVYFKRAHSALHMHLLLLEGVLSCSLWLESKSCCPMHYVLNIWIQFHLI